MNKKDDRRGRAVPVQIPGARWGLCPPRDDVKTSSRGARIAGRGGEARVVEGRLAVLRRAFRAWKRRSSRAVGPALTLVRPPAWKRNVNPSSKPRPRAREAAGGHHAGRATPGAPPARSRDRPRGSATSTRARSPARALARPPSAGSGPATSSRPCPRAGGPQADHQDLPAPPARQRGEPTALAASARPGRRASPPSPPAGSDRGGTVLGCLRPVMASRRSSGAADGLRRTAPGRSGPCPPRPDVVRRWGRYFCAGARLHARLARLGSDRRGRWRRPGRRRGPPVRGDGSSRTVMGRYGSMRRGIADHCEDGAARGAPVATAVGGARGRCRNLVRRSPVERRFRPISMRN